MAPTDGNAQLLAMYDQASRDSGFGPVTAVRPDRAGAADVSFVAGEVPMVIDGVGLMGRDDHTVNETADLRDAAVADQARGGAAASAATREIVRGQVMNHESDGGRGPIHDS